MLSQCCLYWAHVHSFAGLWEVLGLFLGPMLDNVGPIWRVCLLGKFSLSPPNALDFAGPGRLCEAQGWQFGV